MHGLRRTLTQIDSVIYKTERTLLAFSLLMMTLLVFGDVIVRTFTRPLGKTAAIIIAIFGIDDAKSEAAIAGFYGPLAFHIAMGAACIFAVHSAKTIALDRGEGKGPTILSSVAFGLLAHAIFAVFVKILITVFPTGIAGAQKFALGFMVWAGLLGASIATRSRRHIVIDTVKKSLDDKTFSHVSFVGALFTSAFCFVLTFLSAAKLHTQISEWLENPNIGVFDALPIPEWIVTLAIPISFFMIGARFLAQGISDLLYGKPIDSGVDFLAGLDENDSSDEIEQAPEASTSLVFGTVHKGNEGLL